MRLIRRRAPPEAEAVWWDERRPGGRLRGLVFLLHPGPSLLVTATFVAIACLAAGRLPGALRAVQLSGLMLPIQFAIGVSNDACDLGQDAATKPYKPLVRGVLRRQAAVALGVALGCAGLVAAGTISFAVLGLAAAGLAAGLAYNVGVGRTPFSLLPWWAAFVVLPLAAFVAVGRSVPWVGVLVALSALLALSLHCANALPDIDGDRASGRRSLPVLLGSPRSWIVALAAMAAAGVVAGALSVPLGQRLAVVLPGAAVALTSTGAAFAMARRRPFPALAVGGAALAVTWLAALPVR